MNIFEGQYWQSPDGTPAVGATVVFSSDPAGQQPIATYDLTGAPLALVTSDAPPGWQQQFQADALQGYLTAGGQSTFRLAMGYVADQLSQIATLQSGVSIAQQDAASAAALASQAQQSASAVQTSMSPLAADSGITQAQLDAV